jgi:hypothetical protein
MKYLHHMSPPGLGEVSVALAATFFPPVLVVDQLAGEAGVVISLETGIGIETWKCLSWAPELVQSLLSEEEARGEGPCVIGWASCCWGVWCYVADESPHTTIRG